MTLQRFVFELKEAGASDDKVRVTVCAILTARGYIVTNLTRLVIEKHLKNYAQFNQEVA